jgi:hypothetical protein
MTFLAGRVEEFSPSIVDSMSVVTHMKTICSAVIGAMLTTALISVGQEPVLIAGGPTPPTALGVPAAAAEYAVPVAYAAPIPCAPAGQVVVASSCQPPNVVYFGGPNSLYYNSYNRDYSRPSFSGYSPTVVYFGRGEACQRGYAFRHYR